MGGVLGWHGGTVYRTIGTGYLGTCSGGVVAVAGFGASGNMLGTMFHTQCGG